MFCTKCGKEVNGEFCEHCGNQIGVNSGNVSQVVNDSQHNLVIKRKGSFLGCGININLTINGNSYYLSNGQELFFTLVPGENVITYKVWCRRLKTINLNVEAGKSYIINFVPDLLWGGFKVSSDSILQ